MCLFILIFLLPTTSCVPNILVLLADDLGWGDTGYQGGVAFTPHLDTMSRANSTLRLARMYAVSPVCSPSRAALLTGRNPNRFCMWGSNTGWNNPDLSRPQLFALPASEPSLPSVLQAHGYRTAVFGKWHLGDLSGDEAAPPDLRGFGDWLCTGRSAPTLSLNCGCFPEIACQNGHYRSDPSCINYWTSTGENRTVISWPRPIPGEDSLFLYHNLKRFILSARLTRRPFFAYVPLHAVHTRYVATDTLRRLYLSRGYTPDQADYFGAISALDRTVGLVRSLLRRMRMEMDTILWFLSDNGPARGTPGTAGALRGHKGELWEGGVRVPGLLEWPRVVTQNREIPNPVMTSDIFPTILEILNLTVTSPRELDGVSVLPLIRGETLLRGGTGWAYNVRGDFSGRFQVSWLEGDMKALFMFNSRTSTRSLLFDLSSDPAETRDLSTERPQTTARMLSAATEWLRGLETSATNETECLR